MSNTKANGSWRSCLEFGQSHHRNQVASETVHGARLAAELARCGACVEENKACLCEEEHTSSSRVPSLETGCRQQAKANSSFAHSVVNMAGMLIAWTAAFGGIRSDQTIPVLVLHKIPGISGLYIFSYAGHIVFPNIYKDMKDPSKFTKVSITSFTLVTILYTSLAFMGAKLFGPTVSSQITLSMPPHLIVTKIALWAVVLTPMTKYALEFAPFAIQLEHSLPATMSSRARTIIRGTIGSLLLLIILALALSIPYFEHVLSLTGSLVSIGISVVIPCVFYLRICWPSVSRPGVVLNGVLIIVGVVFGVVGTVSSFKSLVQSMQRGHV